MDAPVRHHGEVEQQRRVASHRLVVGVHQLREALHVGILRRMVEPSRTDAGVRLARHPHLAVLGAVVQQRPRQGALARQQAPVCLTHVAGFGAYPAEVATLAARIAPDDGVRLQFADHAERLVPSVVVLGDAALLVRSAVPAITTIGAVEPHLEDVAVLRQ